MEDGETGTRGRMNILGGAGAEEAAKSAAEAAPRHRAPHAGAAVAGSRLRL